jgi:hypothetical protein
MLASDKTHLHGIGVDAFRAYQYAAEAKDAVNTTETAVQHRLAVAANESDAGRVAQMANAVRQISASAPDSFTHLSSPDIVTLRQSLAAYQSAVGEVVQAATTNPASATMLMARSTTASRRRQPRWTATAHGSKPTRNTWPRKPTATPIGPA